MPRTRGYQPPRAANDQAYGVRGDQVSAQKEMPIPQTAPPGLKPGPQSAPGPVTAAPPPGPPGPGQPGIPPDIMQAAASFAPPVPLSAGSIRPREPVTAGLSTGPGPGPEALNSMFQTRRDRVALTMRQLADDLGDPYLQQLADRAEMQAGR